jgi:CIC family chloride channel protein
MADSGLTRLIVTARDDPARAVGVVSLTQLLEGRVRDLHEATTAERVLRLPLGRGSRRGRPAPVGHR